LFPIRVGGPGMTNAQLPVMPGLVPGIHIFEPRVEEDVDGRDIGVRKHAVLRTAMPGHDIVDRKGIGSTCDAGLRH
jgi:hypothetical protein